MPEKEPKISTAEAVIIGMFVLTLDAIDLIPFAGDLTDVAAAPLIFYYYTKHINGVAFIASEILDAIPATQEFPTRTLVWIGTVLFDRFAPAKVQEAVEAVGELGDGLEGGAGELEEGEAAAAETEGAGAATQASLAEEEELNEEIEAEAVKKQESSGKTSEGEGEQEEPRRQGSRGSDDQEDEDEESKGDNGGDLMASGSEISPEEEAEEKLFTMEGADNLGAKPEEDQEEEAPSNVVSGQRFKDAQNKRDADSAAPVPFEDIKRKKAA